MCYMVCIFYGIFIVQQSHWFLLPQSAELEYLTVMYLLPQSAELEHPLELFFSFDSDVFDDNSIAKCNQNQSILLWDVSD